MQIDTIVFGPVEVVEDNILHMPQGPFGFESIKNYALIEKQDEDVTLRWLQAVDDTFPCFVVFDPFEIIIGYEPVIEPRDLKSLGCKSRDDLTYFVIAVVPEDVTKTTVNLKSPIVINKKNKLASQVILANNYPIRFSLTENAD